MFQTGCECRMVAASVLITGANRGLGLEMVRHLLSSPAPPTHLLATYRSPASSGALEQLATAHPSLTTLQLDVTETARFPEVVARVEEVVGAAGLNLLINNAGVGRMPRALHSITPEEMVEHFATNCVAPLFLSRSLLPLLKRAAGPKPGAAKSARKAAVINLSAYLGSLAEVGATSPGMYPIRCSRAALNMATATMAKDMDLMRTGVLLAAIYPGWMRTAMGGPKAPLDPAEQAAAILSTVHTLTEAQHGAFMDYSGKAIPW